jgi:hypothetical protein
VKDFFRALRQRFVLGDVRAQHAGCHLIVSRCFGKLEGELGSGNHNLLIHNHTHPSLVLVEDEAIYPNLSVSLQAGKRPITPGHATVGRTATHIFSISPGRLETVASADRK